MKKTERTRHAIIAAARTILLEEGLSTVTMEMVADRVACHRRTLYRHFPQKEDLLYEVAIALIDEINVQQRALSGRAAEQHTWVPQSGLTANTPPEHPRGIEEFSSFLHGLASYLSDHKAIVRFLGEFDFFFHENATYRPSPTVSSRFLRSAHVTEEILTEIVNRGRRDGSIRTDVDPSVFVPTVTTVLWSMAQRTAIRGSLIQAEFGLSGLRMVEHQIQLYAQAIATKGVDR